MQIVRIKYEPPKIHNEYFYHNEPHNDPPSVSVWWDLKGVGAQDHTHALYPLPPDPGSHRLPPLQPIPSQPVLLPCSRPGPNGSHHRYIYDACWHTVCTLDRLTSFLPGRLGRVCGHAQVQSYSLVADCYLCRHLSRGHVSPDPRA